MSRFVVLCEKSIGEFRPAISSAPEADSHPKIAMKVAGFDDASDAERAIVRSNCDYHHFILEVAEVNDSSIGVG